MSWVKLDDGAAEHPKLLCAGAPAAWLWICCLSYCNRQKRRDGVVPRAKIALLYPGLGLKQAKRLVEVGLLHEHPDGYLIHGYHEYQPSESLSDTRSMAGKQGGIKSGEARRSKREAIASENREAKNEAPARPGPAREEIPLPPSDLKPPDPFRDSLTGRRTQDDPGVVAVFEAWKLAHGFTGAKLRQPADYRADILLETLKTHDVPTCLRVLEASKTDAMVTGKADEQGQEHRSIEYLFKPATFDRLLRAAEQAQSKKPKSASDVAREARRAVVDS